MPKEFIHSRDFGSTYRSHNDCSDNCVGMGGDDPCVAKQVQNDDNDAIKVGWSKEQEHVELAVCQTVEGAFVEHGFESILDAGDETDPEKLLAIGRLTPRYIQMNRHGLNRLIRTLRQARDDAFGRDE